MFRYAKVCAAIGEKAHVGIGRRQCDDRGATQSAGEHDDGGDQVKALVDVQVLETYFPRCQVHCRRSFNFDDYNGKRTGHEGTELSAQPAGMRNWRYDHIEYVLRPMKPLLIIKVGNTLPDLVPSIGDFERWIAQAIEDPSMPIQVVDPRGGDALPCADDIAGAVVTGSHAMVTERREWSERTALWLAGVVAQDVPLLGICYGHQLLAHALGGEVNFLPGGIEIGTTTIHHTDDAANDDLLGDLPRQFAAHTVHAQSVLRLPPHAVLLAHNDVEPHHAFRVGACAWGVQFHPEFGSAAMRAYVRHLDADVQRQGGDVDALIGKVRETPVSASVLRRFGQIVRQRC